MSDGFDVGLVRQPRGFRDMIGNMCHGAKIAILGIPSEDMATDWRKVA